MEHQEETEHLEHQELTVSMVHQACLEHQAEMVLMEVWEPQV